MSQESTAANSFRNALWVIVQPLLLSAASLPATAYVIRSLGAMGYGQWGIGASLIATVNIFTSLGLRTLFALRVTRNPARACHELAYQLGLRSVLALLAGACAILICLCLHYPTVVVLCTAIPCIGLFLSTLSGALEDLLQGLEYFKSVSNVNSIAGLLLTLASVVAVHLRRSPVDVALAYLVGPAINCCALAVLVHRRVGPVRIRWNITEFKALLGESKMVGASQIVGVFRDRVEQLILPKLVGATQFGLFTAGYLLPDRLGIIPSGLACAFFPLISRTYNKDRQLACKQIQTQLLVSLALCIPLALLIAYLAHPIAALLFPKSASICRMVIQITVWYIPLAALLLPINNTMVAAGKHSLNARISIYSALCSLAFSIFLVSRYGVIGACWACTLRPLVGLLWQLPYFYREFPEVFLLFPLPRLAVCAGMMACFLRVANDQTRASFYMILVICIAAIFGYVLLLAIVGIMPKSFILQAWHKLVTMTTSKQEV